MAVVILIARYSQETRQIDKPNRLASCDAYISKTILGAKYKPSPHSLEVPPISRLD